MLLPTFLRQPVLLSVLRAPVQPLVSLSDSCLSQRTDTLFGLQHTGQVCCLKDALNRYFGLDDYDAGFEIEDINAEGDFRFAYDETENLAEQQWLTADEPDGDIIYDEEVILVTTKSFVVLVPASVYDAADKMPIVRKIVEKYRLVSRLPMYKRSA